MNSNFTTPLLVEILDDRDRRLFSDFSYYSEHFNVTITVPAGFVTDFASVPKVPLAYWLVGGIANKPSCIHDYLYRACIFERAVADYIFKEGMEVILIQAWKRQAMYKAVRTFGGQHYCKGNRWDSRVGNTRALGLPAPPPVAKGLVVPVHNSEAMRIPRHPGVEHVTVKEILQ